MGMDDGLTGRVVRPGDADYGRERLDYNLAIEDRYPRLIVGCDGVRDVQNAVRFAGRSGLPLRARSGRHSYEAYSVVDGGIVVDVSAMAGVALGPDGTARIGAGANLGTVYRSLWDQGHRAVAGGTCGGVGIAGLTLGGGFGLLGRRHGLTCDRLTALEMVDAGGRVVRADDRSAPDLMWASRGGGGGNFGVVTALEFATVPVAEVCVFRILWPWDALGEAFDAYQRWADPETLDRRLSPVMNLKARRVGNVAAFGQFLGPLEDLTALVAPLLRAVRPLEAEFRRMSFIQAVDHFGGAAPGEKRWAIHSAAETGERFKNTSAYQHRLFPAEAIRRLRDHLADSPSAACLVQVDTYGGAIRDLSDTATAFPHRQGVRAVLQPQAYWDTRGQASAHRAWVESLRQALEPYTRGGYINYIDRAVGAWPRFYYGANLARLVAIKRRYDPDDLFEGPQSLGRLTAAGQDPDG